MTLSRDRCKDCMFFKPRHEKNGYTITPSCKLYIRTVGEGSHEKKVLLAVDDHQPACTKFERKDGD